MFVFSVSVKEGSTFKKVKTRFFRKELKLLGFSKGLPEGAKETPGVFSLDVSAT